MAYPEIGIWLVQNHFQGHFYSDEVLKLQKNSAYVLPTNNAASTPANKTNKQKKKIFKPTGSCFRFTFISIQNARQKVLKSFIVVEH